MWFIGFFHLKVTNGEGIKSLIHYNRYSLIYNLIYIVITTNTVANRVSEFYRHGWLKRGLLDLSPYSVFFLCGILTCGSTERQTVNNISRSVFVHCTTSQRFGKIIRHFRLSFDCYWVYIRFFVCHVFSFQYIHF